MESEKFKFKLLGLSEDSKTNKWLVTCKKCNKSHTPTTTMIATQLIKCECGEKETINYNNLK